MTISGTTGSTRGAKVKALEPSRAVQIISRVIAFLKMLMTETLAKRIVGIVLLSVGVPDSQVSELTGMSERAIRDLRKKLRDDTQDEDLFQVSGGSERERKLKDIERIVVDTIENNDFHTQQEIADMIFNQHGITVHRSTVSRLIKKTLTSG